jgi:hypothetical protein
MDQITRSRWILVFMLLVLLSMGCGIQSFIPNIPTFPPKPGTSNVPTGSSPMSGDWNADTDFGHIAFTVDPDGNNVVTTVISMSGWTCGGTTISTELQILNSWSISGDEFAGQIDLDDSHFHTLTIDGTYDDSRKTFSGTWEEDSHGTTCSGPWEAIARQ